MDLHGRIFDYWKDKCITYKGTIEIEGNYDYSKSIEVVKDWGEPNCWLCGKIINLDDYPFYYEDLENAPNVRQAFYNTDNDLIYTVDEVAYGMYKEN